jgi:hypothetical protein
MFKLANWRAVSALFAQKAAPMLDLIRSAL